MVPAGKEIMNRKRDTDKVAIRPNRKQKHGEQGGQAKAARGDSPS